MLEQVDLRPSLSRAQAKRHVGTLRRRLLELQQACWNAGLPTLVVFEGWDAAVKGDAIRKLTERLEPRAYTVHYLTDAPRSAETDLPWMWRFWNDLPAFGTFALFDRSWYRRLLLERLHGTADLLRWRRGIRDIVDFERMLADDGYVIVKLFFHLSEAVQRKRFDAWRDEPGTSWKALVGEWSRLAPYDEQLELWEYLLQGSEAPRAPWTFVSAHDRRWARVQTFETVVSTIESALIERGIELPEGR
ncbi:MAG: UDP-galactose-lipid carrier transferase [Thermoanaerobaculia bacterium]|nr:UDP-galactose-lipid carrier transferase [Thermoanaerobaculia bacterium]